MIAQQLRIDTRIQSSRLIPVTALPILTVGKRRVQTPERMREIQRIVDGRGNIIAARNLRGDGVVINQIRIADRRGDRMLIIIIDKIEGRRQRLRANAQHLSG